MAYSELVKNFDKTRGYMRQFFVFGFKSRTEFKSKSLRSYDDERRRVESWLGDYMKFRQEQDGKKIFMSMDSREIPSNPFYEAFKAKSFTPGDISFHFCVLDMLSGGHKLSVRQITDSLYDIYFPNLDIKKLPDSSTVRKKLAEYEALGLLSSKTENRKKYYFINKDNIKIEAWREAIDFYSEYSPLGVIGSYLRDRLSSAVHSCFGFKHHYFLHALDMQVLYNLVLAIHEKRCAIIEVPMRQSGKLRKFTVLPYKIYISTQSGREYLLSYDYSAKRPEIFRLDSILSAKAGKTEKHFEKYTSWYEEFRKYQWGVSFCRTFQPQHLEMTIRAAADEVFIVQRLEREKRNGTVEKIGNGIYKYSVDSYDCFEMLPWLRTFIGRIVDLKCSNEKVVKRFYEDLSAAAKLYDNSETDIISFGENNNTKISSSAGTETKILKGGDSGVLPKSDILYADMLAAASGGETEK